MKPVTTVNCPTCEAPVEWGPQSPNRPFCSERCKNMDFGAWADEGFRVAADPEPDEPPPGPQTLQ